MRGAYDQVCTIRRGTEPTGGVPGSIIADDVPCRVVPQTEIFQLDYPFTECSAWITMPSFTIPTVEIGGGRAGVLWINYNSFTTVEVPKSSGNLYVMIRGEFMFPHGRPFYLRYMMLPIGVLTGPGWPPPSPLPPLPPPPPPAPPATTCSAAPAFAVGSTGSGTSSTSSALWWYVGVTGPGTFTTAFVTGGVGVVAEVYHGPDCSSLVFQGSTTVGSPYVYTTPSGSVPIFIRIAPSASAVPFTLTFHG